MPDSRAQNRQSSLRWRLARMLYRVANWIDPEKSMVLTEAGANVLHQAARRARGEGSECPHGNRFCGTTGWSKCGPCHNDLEAAWTRDHASHFVPLSLRKSRIVAWLWKRSRPSSKMTYGRARWLARWLP